MQIVGLIICALLLIIRAEYDNTAVKIVTDATFDKEVLSGEGPVFVKFYAPWCGHCQKLVPEYSKAAKNLKDIVKIAAVNCDDNKTVCGRYGVKGYPTLKLFKWDAATKKKSVIEYNQGRDAVSIVKFATDNLHSYVVSLTLKNESDFLAKKNPKSIVFSEKSTVSSIYKALSIEFYKQIEFAQISSNEAELIKKYNIKKFPSLFLIKSSGDRVEFEDQINFKQIASFYAEHVPGISHNLIVKKSKVYEVKSQQDLEERCLTKGICLIAFISLLEDYQESVSEYAENTKIFESLMKHFDSKETFLSYVVVNPIKFGQLIKDFNIATMYPGLMMLNAKKKVYRPLTSSFEKPQLIKFVDESLQGNARFFTYTFDPMLVKARDEL